MDAVDREEGVDSMPGEPPLGVECGDGGGQIVNLSKIKLSATEISVLSRGLTFCPSNGKYSELTLLKDLDNFARTLRLREYFFDRSDGENAKPSFVAKHHWTPSAQREENLDLYIRAVQRDVFQAYQSRRTRDHNITKNEQDALNALSNRQDIVIKPADKGGGIVILDRNDYVKEGDRQLGDRKFYKPLLSDPTKEHQKIVNNVLEQLVGAREIDRKLARALTSAHPVVGRFYMLPKLHKIGNPGRPIISGIGTITEPISGYIDYLIRDIPPQFPSYLRDTNHFLQEIEGMVLPDGAFLVTLDVTSLYTNIPHSDGISALIQSYNEHREEDSPSPRVVEVLTRLVLELNSFEFENKYFLQTSGTAMGTKMAPNYATIFMHNIETKFLSTSDSSPALYKRFLDDIFMIWTDTEQRLIAFIEEFNTVHPNISFTYEYSRTEISFLDVQVHVRAGSLETSVYRKPTDRQQYLHFNSCHPRHCRTAIPYSQAHRFRRICSRDEDFRSNASRMRGVLVKQRYPPALVDDAISRAASLNRNTLLQGSHVNDGNNSRANLVLTFTSSPPNVNKILKKHFNILQQSERLSKIFSDPPRVIYRRAKSIGDYLVHAKDRDAQQLGCRPCGKNRCLVCKHVQTARVAISTHSDFRYSIRGSFDCDSSNLVYLLECGGCNMQYIGQTDGPFRMRFNNHRYHTKALPNLPLSRHLAMQNHSFDDIKVTLLQSSFSSCREREQCESYLIYKFNTLKGGLNESPGTMTVIRTLHDH